MALDGDFWAFSQARPSYHAIYSTLPTFPKNWSPCCAQLSVAFHRIGEPMDKRAAPCKETYGPTPRYLTYDGIVCIIQVGEMYWYLKDKYGDPDRYTGSEQELRQAIAGRFGIILFGWEHVDVWADQGLADTSLPYKMGYLFGCESIRKRGLFFWEIQDSSSSDTDS